VQSLKIRKAEDTDLCAIRRAPCLWLLDMDHIGTPSDLSFLEGNSALEYVRIEGAKVTDVSALRSCTALKRLLLPRNNAKVDLAPLEGHPSLEWVELKRSFVKSGKVPASMRGIVGSSGNLPRFEAR